jgi:hypothetical protein
MRIVTDAPLQSNRAMSSREWDELLLRQERWLAKRSRRRRRTGSGGLPAFLDGTEARHGDDSRRSSFEAH